MEYKPHPDLDSIDPEFKKKWSAALRECKQFKGNWISEDQTELCCLGVAAQVDGLSKEEISSLNFDKSIQSENVYRLTKIFAASCEDVAQSFATLNDDYLTHPQIADLLDGKTVIVESTESK